MRMFDAPHQPPTRGTQAITPFAYESSTRAVPQNENSSWGILVALRAAPCHPTSDQTKTMAVTKSKPN